MADEDDPVAIERAPQMFDDHVQIGEMARHGEAMRIGLRIEGPTRAALIPVGDHEVLLQVVVVIAKQRTLRAARPAMQPQQDRRVPVRAPGHKKKPGAIHG